MERLERISSGIADAHENDEENALKALFALRSATVPEHETTHVPANPASSEKRPTEVHRVPAALVERIYGLQNKNGARHIYISCLVHAQQFLRFRADIGRASGRTAVWSPHQAADRDGDKAKNNVQV